MRLEHVYPQSIGRARKANGIGFVRTFLLAGILMVFLPLVSSAIFVPSFINSSPQNRTICGNVPSDINTWLSVTDIDLGETLTWTIIAHPGGGTLGGFDGSDQYFAPSGGSMVTPTGLTYTANPGTTNDNFAIMVDDGAGGTAVMTVILTVNAGPSLTLGAMPSVCRGVTSATLSFTDLANVGPDTVVINTVGSHNWTVPVNVTSVKFDVMGASGGNDDYSGASIPGKGGRVQGMLSVAPGTNLNINVGGVGSDGSPLGAAGGFNGGGDAYHYYFGCGGAGGGASDIRVGGTGLANRKVVAGGGGGGGADNTPALTAFAGGHGGGLIGGNSSNNNALSPSNSKGGTQATGGAPAAYFGWTPGGFGTFGNGGAGSVDGVSGGGGAGWYGGGGGVWTGGGGGSSYTDNVTAYSVTHTQGANTGDGMVTLYYTNPGTYTIIWDNDADVIGGFENVADEELPSGNDFTIDVPWNAPAGTYYGVLTINNINCNSIQYPITVTVKPLPVVDNPGDVVVCHGSPVPDIFFSGTVSAGNYNWVNSNPSLGFGPSGSGHIPGEPILNNPTPLPATATFTVTPVENGCIGLSQVFNIVDNPIPTLNSTTTPPSICNGALFSYIPNSLTPGTTFQWSRAEVPGISNLAASGTGNPNENLINTTANPIAVVYTYTLTANTCENIESVTVMVNPTPSLSSTLSPAPLCNNGSFEYTPASLTTDAVLTWSRPVVAGISNAAASGTGAINETLLNVTTTPKNVTYVITLNIDGCVYTQNVTVTVNPPLTLTSPTALGAMCDGNTLNYGPVPSVSSATMTWNRAAVPGISNAAGTGTGNISEALYNTTPNPVVVTYVYTLSAFGCSNNINVTKTVNPRARLSSSLNPGGICTNTLFAYTPASLTPGATFQWARDNVDGISNPATPVLTGSVSEILVNFTDLPISVPYLYTTTAYGCAHADTVRVTVNPSPRIVNDTTTLAVCDSALFSFTPVSATPGATYAWSRAYEAGIANLGATGTTGNPNERLNNTTYISVPATYMYTITANGCTNSQNVVVQVRPSAILTHNTATTCSGAPFTFEPISYTTLTTFAWARANVPGVTPATATGTGSILDTLTHSSSTAMTVVYDYNLTIFGCVNKQKVTVTVETQPAVPVIGTAPSGEICNNRQAVNFGADVPAPDGFSYSWSATNATLVATGNSKQFAIFNFNTAGTASVTLTTRSNKTTCATSKTMEVKIGNGYAEVPELIYYDRQFICKQTDVTTYQWGYDDRATLDSVILVGETNQNYHNEFPEFDKKSYWVMTTRNGCTQKTYYNAITGVADVNMGAATMKIFPNPADNYINVEVSRIVTGEIRMDVFNMLGQQVQSVNAQGNKAQINVANMPAGVYVVDCYSDGIKVTAARFIKN